ncbi:MAG TPA: dihydrolipoamide acetyltransferase family protein [Gemmatimonadales bacterium]|jgi:2-oxoglutarate dehydrogenase E2 component (dihydrolipoamide succinyltransferase)|nr:dihydrolipoamide acetyltransferase family protein [Gemmatimonadales bacterium]
MATIDVIMPQMGESIAEGTLSRWIKKAGEAVKRDEPIFEISTDKVDAEIPAPAAGVLSEILVQEGQTVAVQTVVARIDTEAAAGAAKPAAAAPAPAAAGPAPAGAAPAAPASSAAAAPSPSAPKAAAPAPAPAAPRPAPAARPAAEKPRPGHVAEGNGEMETAEERLRRRSTPVVRKMVAEHNLDLSEIPGTGLAGRVTKNDVLGYIEGGAAGQRGGGAVAPAGIPAAEPAVAAAPQPRGPAAPGVEPWAGDTVQPWSRIRKLTAEHMVMSRRVSPHVNTVFEIDYTRVAQLRARKKKEYADRGVNLTFLAFIAKATADALRQHPTLNAAVSGESTILRRDINLGIAVALDWGLIVPVIRRADELALLGLARAINDLGERARGKKLSPDEVQKGTFTITNPGVFGSVIGTPIINQPQAAILCVGSIEKQPAVITVDGTDTLAVRTKGMLSLAFDHRIVDGADADRFMADVKKTLQEFPEAAV